MSQFNPVPDPTRNGLPVVDEDKAKLDLDANLQNHAAQQANSIVMGARYYDEMDRLGQMTGQDALKGYVKRMDSFQKALDSGSYDDIQTWEKLRLDVSTTAERHATENAFFVESVHSGAWEQARSMTSDEHHGFLGTDLRARNQFIHDASQSSDVAQILGLENSPEFLAAVAARGVDASQEGSYEDSISNPFQSLLNYDDISDMISKRTDSAWTLEAQDNAWEAMNSSEAGSYLLQATGIKRETLARFTNQDALIYGMNRMYKEAKFQQHASSDDFGGMVETFGQMLPTILNDPDTIGEVGLALLLAVPSGGASVYVGAAAKAGNLTKNTLRMQKLAKGLATAGRLLPTRVLGDFVVPGLKALKATRGSKELLTTQSKLRHAWNNLDAYDNWVTFAMGASADGSVGGVGAFLMNTDRIDGLNDVVYGKGVVPSVRNFDMIALRGVMGVAGAITLGSALRVGFKGLAMAADKGLKTIQNSGYGTIKGADNKAAASTAVTTGITRKLLAKQGIEDEAVVTSTAAGIERDSARAGVAPTIVAARLRDEVDLEGITGTPAEQAALIREWAHEIVRDEFMKPAAIDARLIRNTAVEKEIRNSKSSEAARIRAEDGQARDNIQTGAIVSASRVENGSDVSMGEASKTTAEDADPVMDDLFAANKAVDDARAAKREADEARKASKLSQKQTEKAEAEADAKQKAEIDAQNKAAEEAKQTQIEEQERALKDAENVARDKKAKAQADLAAKKAAEDEAAEAKAELYKIKSVEAKAGSKLPAEDSTSKGSNEQDAKYSELANKNKNVKLQKLENDARQADAKVAKADEEAKASVKDAEESTAKVESQAKVVEETKAEAVEVKPGVEARPIKSQAEAKEARAAAKKSAKKAQAETSVAVHTAEMAQAELRKAIARRLGVDEVEVDAIAAQVVSWRMLSSAAGRAHDVVDGFNKEGFEEIPVAVLRHVLAEVSPDYAQRFDSDEATMTLAEAHAAIDGAKVVAQGQNFKGLTEDPNAIFLASRFTRGSYEQIAAQIKERQEEGPAAAYRAAEQLKALTGGGNLRDFAFRDNKAYLEGRAYFERAMDNLNMLNDTLSAVDLKLDKSLDKMILEVEADYLKIADEQLAITARQELHTKFGYPAEIAENWKQVSSEELMSLIAYHRYLNQLDEMNARGDLSPEAKMLLGLDSDQQRIYFTNVISQADVRLDELKAGGHNRFIDEVEMYDVARAYFGPESNAGTNLRDAIFGNARVNEGVNTGKFDLIEVRRLAEDRLALVDADFNQARSMAARVEIARLEGKVADGKADLSDRIRLAQFNSAVKAVNEIDYLEAELIAPYRAVSAEQAAKKREELGEEAWAVYLKEEEDALYAGARNALFGNHGMSEGARRAIFKRHGLPVPMRGSSPTEQWKSAVAPKLVELAAKELGFDSPMDLVNGKQGFVRGNQAGMALILMNRDSASLSGSTAAEIKAGAKTRSRGEAYNHVAFGPGRTQNPTGNLKIQKQVRMIEEFMLKESERQILFNADGSPRQLSLTESKDIIAYYEGMKGWTQEEIQAGVPNHPFEQKARGLHLVAREEKALGSPVKDWKSPAQKVKEYTRKLLQDPVNLHQGIHDDLTLMMREGVAVSDMGAVGPMTMRNSQGAGSLDGLGAGWQTVATTPGSIMDWLNIRSGMVFRQFDGMDAFARAVGLESLKEMRDAIVANDLRPKMYDQDIEIPAHIASLKGEALKAAAEKAGIKKSLKVGEKRKLLAMQELGGGKSEAELRKAAELLTLVELDTAVRKVDQMIREEAFRGGTLADAKKFDEELNSWDAASQAVSLAKGLLNAAVHDANKQKESGKTDANTKAYSNKELRSGIDEVMTAMGWDKSQGLLTEEIRMEMLRSSARTQDVSDKLGEADLAEVAADFYSKVWDGMVDIPAGPDSDGFGRLTGNITDDTGKIGPSEIAYGNGRFTDFGLGEAGRDLWNHLFDEIGSFGSKQEIGEQRGSSDAAIAAKASMKKFLRDKLMKRPVMTRAYGAGGDAMANAITDFLEEAFSLDTPEASAFRGLVETFNPALASRMEAEAKTGNRQANSSLYQVASALGWAFADKASKKWKGEGGLMGAILEMPDAKTFRDVIRNMNSLHEDAFSSDVDLRIKWRGREVGEDSVKTQKGDNEEFRNITLDDLYSQRSIEDTFWEKEPKVEGETAKEKSAREQRNEEATFDDLNSFYEQVQDKAIQVANRRGWDQKHYSEDLRATLGRWHMRNLLLVKSGAATEAQVKEAEFEISSKMAEILNNAERPETELRDFLENWLTKRDELTIRAMNSIGFKMRDPEVDGALGSVGLRTDDLNPKFRLARESGAQLHSSVHSSAGRGWTGAGQGAKGWINPADPDRSVRPVYRAMSDEYEAPSWELDNTVARNWQDMSFEQREEMAMQLAAQDLMIDFLGVQKPPLDLIEGSPAYKEPTVEDFFRDWAANDSRAVGIRDGMESIRQEYRAAYRAENGELPHELSDILWDDIRSQVPATRTHTLFGQDDANIMTDAGIPQLQAYRLRRTADVVMRDRIKAARDNKATGIGIKMSELSVPAPLKMAGRMNQFIMRNPQPVSATRSFDAGRMENDKEWLQNWAWREVTDFSNSIGIEIENKNDFADVFRLMHMERAFQSGFASGESKMKSSKNGDGFDLQTPEGRKGFMDTVQRDIQSYLEELMGMETEVAAKKEAGTRSVSQLPDTGMAFPARSLLASLREQYVMTGRDQGPNWMHADAVLGPAHREGIVLKGSNTTSGALITGIMSKSVFGNDFGIGMGAAEESVRFGHWFLMQKFNLTREEAAFKFGEYSARRLEDDADGAYYQEKLNEWKAGEVEEGWIPNATATLMGLGSVRETLLNDPEAMKLAQDLFGITRAEELTEARMLEMINDEGGPSTLKVEGLGTDKRRPMTYLDALGRELTLSRVPAKTLLWKTMSQYRDLGIDPKSQPMIRRLWFASMLETKLEKLDLVGQMGAREVRSRAFSHLAPDTEGKVSESRIAASHNVTKEITDGANSWSRFAPLQEESGRVIRRDTTLNGLAETRGEQILDVMAEAGVDFDKLEAELNKYYENESEKYPSFKREMSDPITGEKWNEWTPEAKVAAWAFYISGKDQMKMRAMGEYASRGVRGGLESMADSPAGALRRGGITEGEGQQLYTMLNTMEAMVDLEAIAAVKQDISAIVGETIDTETGPVSRLQREAVMSVMPQRDLITDAGQRQVMDDLNTEDNGKLITEGKPGNDGPIFGNGRTIINEFDKIIREKRYPALNALMTQLRDNGAFKDEAAAREFGLMMAMNMDLLGDLLPGVKFQFTGETGTSRMQTIVENSSKVMLHRIQVLKDMKNMEGIEVFDIIAHELSHAIIHRGQAKAKGMDESNRYTNALMTSLRGHFRRRITRGSTEDLRAFADAFEAIYGKDKGTELFQKFHADIKDGNPNRMDKAVQEFGAQFMSWYLLARTDTAEVAGKFGPELAAMYRGGFGERLRKLAKLYEEPGMKQQPGEVLKRLAMIGNTAEPVRWSGEAAFNQMFYNHSSNINSETALIKAREEVLEEATRDGVELDELPALRNKWVSINNRLAELGHATPSERMIASIQRSLITPDRKSTIAAMRESGLDLDARASLARRNLDGEFLSHEEFGRVNLKGFTDGERKIIVDHMIDGKIAGRRETVGDSSFRKVAMMAGEGIALQGTSSAWRSTTDEIQWAANLLNNMLGFEERSGSRAFDMGMSQQEIQTLQRSLYGKPMSAAIELFEMAQKKDATFMKAVDDAFEDRFAGGAASKESLDRLSEINPHAANLVEVAADAFAKLYDRAYKNAESTGDMQKWVVDELTGDGNRQLPIQLSQIVKEDSAMREMSLKVGAGIREEQLLRLDSDPAAGNRAGFVNAQFLHDYGLFAPWKAEMSSADRASHVDTLDSVYGSRLVDQITDEGKLHIDESYPLQFGGNRTDEFFLASEVLQKRMEAGKYHAPDMPDSLREAYRAVMNGEVSDAVITNAKDQPFFMRNLAKDFPDPEDQAKFKAILISGDKVVTPADYEAMKMLYRSRHGGYSFADSRFMNAKKFGRILSEGIEGRGINRTPLNVMKTFMAFDHGVTDKFFNQEYYGITGFGYSNLLSALKDRVHRSRMSEKGTHIKLSEKEKAAAIKEIESLEAQHKLAMGRNPSYKDDAGNDFIEAIAPTIQTAVGLATTPNWTTASLIVEGTAGLVNRAAKMFTEGTKFTLPKYAGDMGAMRDSMHAIGITMPYHMTKLGFGHIWNMGDEASAAIDLDPSLKESFHDKANKKIRRLGSFAFERVQLSQREAAMIPAQQLLRKMLIPGADGNSKVMNMSRALGSWIASNPEGTVDAKLIRRLATENGVKKDVASQLYSLGLLSSDGARRVSEMAQQFMPDNQFLKYEDMFDSITWRPDREAGEGREDILSSGKAATGLQQLLFNQVAKTNMEPKVGTTNLNTNPFVRMWQQLSQYSILFMRETMASLASTGLGATAGLLLPLYFGEVMWYSLNRMKNGDSPASIREDWINDAPGQMVSALSRMPVFGAGSFINDLFVNAATSTIGKLSGGAVFSSKADERSFGMNTPGMPGPSMMIQSITAFADLVKQGGAALFEGDYAEAGNQAKEFLYKYGPADFRPIIVAGLRTATSDFKDGSNTPDSRLVPNLRVPRTFTALPAPGNPGPDSTPAQARARDYGQLKADALAGVNPPVSQNPGGDSPAANQATGTPQAGSSGLSGPNSSPTSGGMGPGSAGGPLVDKLGR